MFPVSFRASQVVLVVNNPLANAGNVRDEVWSLGQEDPLEKEMATHYSILAWETPWTEELGKLRSIESQRGRHNLVTKQQQHCFFVLKI